MSDRIKLEGLEVEAGIGVYDHERGVTQRLVIDVTAETDVAAAAATDELSLSLDYDAFARICREEATTQHHELIETVAEKIAGRILAEHPGRVQRVHVRVAKPGAVPDARTVAVEITRPR